MPNFIVLALISMVVGISCARDPVPQYDCSTADHELALHYMKQCREEPFADEVECLSHTLALFCKNLSGK